jgi:hypothetical protein
MAKSSALVFTLAFALMSLLPFSGEPLLLALRSSDQSADVVICRASDAVSPSGAAPDERRNVERTFMAENEAAMGRMMNAMAISPTGDVDRDFLAMMVPHHQGAIDMAVAELRHGRNEQLRRIAQEIIVTQGQEVRAMYQAVHPADTAPNALE